MNSTYRSAVESFACELCGSLLEPLGDHVLRCPVCGFYYQLNVGGGLSGPMLEPPDPLREKQPPPAPKPVVVKTESQLFDEFIQAAGITPAEIKALGGKKKARILLDRPFREWLKRTMKIQPPTLEEKQGEESQGQPVILG